MERTPGNIRVVDQADPAVAAQLSQEIDAFNMAAVGLHDWRSCSRSSELSAVRSWAAWTAGR